MRVNLSSRSVILQRPFTSNKTTMHVDTLLHPGWIITINAQHPVLEGYSIAIQNGRICALCPQPQARREITADQIVDLPGQVVMPGLINMHGHAPMNLFRGMADDLPLKTWLEEHIWPAEGRWLGPDFIRDGSALAIAEMLRGGTTLYSDNYFFLEHSVPVIRQSGIRAQLCPTIIDFPTNWAKTAEEHLQKSLNLAASCAGDEKILVTLGPHAPYSVSDKPLIAIRKAAERHNLHIQMHVHETQHEVNESLKHYGKRPIARLDALGLLDSNMQCVHVVAMNDQDIQTLAERGASVVHCPESNLKLASGFSPVQAMHNAGIRVTIGTDGAASNNDLDMLGEMRTAAMLAKAVSNDAQAMNAEQTLRAATINAAAVLGLDQEIGSVEIGKQADLIAIDLDRIECQPLFDPRSQVVYATSREQVSHVWIQGEAVLTNRQLHTLDLEQIRTDAQKWRSALAK